MVSIQRVKHPTILIIALGILNTLTPFSIDLYLPAFPDIARDLGSTVERVSLSVAIYFIGFALGQLFYGPLLDRFGRKPPIYFGLGLYIVGSLGCMTARSVDALLMFRLVTAFGGCASAVGAITMVRDYFPSQEGAKIFASLMLVLSVSPMLAPSVGSLIVMTVGWRWIFGLLTAIALFDVALVAFLLPVAYVPDRTVQIRPIPILRNFGVVLKTPGFAVYTVAGSLSFAGLFVYVSGAPSIFMDEFGLSARAFGLVFAVLAGGMIGGGQVNRFLVDRYGSRAVFRTTLALQVFSSLFFFAGVAGVGLGFWTTATFLFAILVCAGIGFPNAATLALEPFTQNIGSASALMGFLQLGIGSFTSAFVGLSGMKGTLPTATVMAASSLCGASVLAWGTRQGLRVVGKPPHSPPGQGEISG